MKSNSRRPSRPKRPSLTTIRSRSTTGSGINITWQPTWGGIQNADLTLSAQRGNAMDIAGLTIALLRASKIPARYVHGTIDVPAMLSRTGPAASPASRPRPNSPPAAVSRSLPSSPAARSAKSAWSTSGSKRRLTSTRRAAPKTRPPTAGPAWTPATNNTNIKKAWMPWPSAASIPSNWRKTSSPAAPSTKRKLGDRLRRAYCSKCPNPGAAKTGNLYPDPDENPTVGDVIGGARPSSRNSRCCRPACPTARRHRQPLRQAAGQPATANPLQLRQGYPRQHDRSCQLSVCQSQQPEDHAVVQAGHRSRRAGAEILAARRRDHRPQPTAATIPSYLVNVVPELTVNGQIVKTGSAMKLGEELPFITALSFAGRGQIYAPRTYNVIAGSYLAVNAYAGSVSPAQLQATKTQLEQTKTALESADQAQIGALTREDLLGDLFHAGGLGYYAQLIALSHIMGLQTGGHQTWRPAPAPSVTSRKSTIFFGFPKASNPAAWCSTSRCSRLMRPMTAIRQAETVRPANRYPQLGFGTCRAGADVRQRAKPRRSDFGGQSPAESQCPGQRIYQITPANQSTILPNIHHDTDTMDEIRNALNAGKEVITHTDAVSVPGWSGAGYIITDPMTGDGAYKISGGGNGGGLAFYIFGAFIGLVISEIFITVILSATGGPMTVGAAAMLGIYTLSLLAPVLALATLMLQGANETQTSCFIGGLFLGLSAASYSIPGIPKVLNQVLYYVGTFLGFGIPATGDIGTCLRA